MASRVQHILGRLREELWPHPAPNLAGDREIEWSFMATRVGRFAKPHSKVLDCGCGNGVVSLAAILAGARVTAVDLLPLRRRHWQDGDFVFRQADAMTLDPRKELFDVILACSVVEHIGLPDRYGGAGRPEGDLQAMGCLRRLLKPGGRIVATLPVGRDAVVGSLHRIYGEARLPRLWEGVGLEEERFWAKDGANRWEECSKATALEVRGNDHYYALGAFVARRAET
jgi:SAM-dependent methyltransferase